MRVTRGAITWTLHPTTAQEHEIFAAILQLVVPGEHIHRNEYSRPEDGQATALISVGSSVMILFQEQQFSNVRTSAWNGGINIPFIVPGDDDQETQTMLSTMGVCGLTYVGPSDDGLEVYGTKCQYCRARMIDPHQCLTKVCAACAAACEHRIWESGHLVVTADGGIAMGEQCTHCKLTRGPATDDRAGVERDTGVLVITRGDNIREAVNTLLLPDPEI